MSMSDIRDKIISTLGLKDNSSDEEILLALRDALRSTHPDKTTGEETAKYYSSKFDEYKKLYDEFRDELKKAKATDIVVAGANDSQAKIFESIDEITEILKSKEIYDERELLKTRINILESKIKNLSETNSILEKQLRDRGSSDNSEFQKDLKEKFGVKPIGKGISIAIYLSTISMMFTKVRELLSGAIGVPSQVISIVLMCLSLLSITYWLFTKLQQLKVKNLISMMSNPKWISKEVAIHVSHASVYETKQYVYQEDIESAISEEVEHHHAKWWFPFKVYSVIEMITNHVVSHYIGLHVLSPKDTSGFNVIFEIKEDDRAEMI